MKKKLLAILTSVLLLMTAIPLGAVNVSAATSGGYTYTVTDGEATITDYSTSSSYGGAITIPATLGGYPVTTIAYGAFEDCTSLTSVTIPDSVTSIGRYAFYWCTKLTSVTIPDSVTTIGEGAFAGCDSLTSVTIGDSVTTIGDWAFRDCTSLTSVTIGDSVTTIGYAAFYGCDNLISVTIPDSVTSIGNCAFEYCTKLTSVTIPDSVTTIGGGAFESCYSLTSIVIPDGVTTIERSAFAKCYDLASITIPYSVASIEYNAFYRCDSLTDVYYAGTETDRAFIAISTYNDPLHNATWHYTLPSGTCGPNSTWAYYAAEQMLVISGTGYVSGDWRSYTPRYVVIKEGITEVGATYFARAYGDVDVLVIPSTLTTVGRESFMCGANTVILNSAAIAAKATTYDSVGYLFYYNTTTLVNETITQKGSYISGQYTRTVMFNDTAYNMYSDCYHEFEKVITRDFTGLMCRNCKMPHDGPKHFKFEIADGEVTITGYTDELPSTVVIPSAVDVCPVTAIGAWAFYYCDSLTSVTIPDSVTTIGEWAFAYAGLTSVTIGDNVTSIGEWAFAYAGLTSVTIGDNVTSIGNSAFSSCSNLTSVTIPDSVTTIGGGAFSSCSNLTSVTIPNSVTTINDYAFNSCSSLTEVTIPDSVTTIGNYAFYNCSSLTSVTIPDSVTTIGEWAFAYAGLTTVTIGDSVTTIGDSAFHNCDSLTTVTIPDSVTTIGYDAFSGCTSLTSVTIPDGVTAIGAWAFKNCTALTSVTIPDSVTTIGYGAFYSCSNLTDVYYTGSEADRATISIDSSNTYLTNATWHYLSDPISKDVAHSVMDTKNGTGLAFRFELTAKGVVGDNRNVVGLTNATVNYLGKDCKLIGMGTVVTNDATIGEGNLTLDAVNDYDVVNIPAVYLMEAEADYCAFATRIINIPDSAVERTIYARPYYIVEVDGDQITVYGDIDSASCAEYL